MQQDIFDPVTVNRLVAALSDAETQELETYVRSSDNPAEFCIKTTEWLRRRFPQMRNLESN